MDSEDSKRKGFRDLMHRFKGQFETLEQLYREGSIDILNGDGVIEEGKRWLLDSAYSSLEGEGEFYIPVLLKEPIREFLDIVNEADLSTKEGFEKANNAYKALLDSPEYTTALEYKVSPRFHKVVKEFYNKRKGYLPLG